MRLAMLFAALLFFSARQGLSQSKPGITFAVDSFFSDSGIGFDGQYNRCVWVFCGKQPKHGDTLRIIKLCGGMIGACPESWTLQNWNHNGWHLDHSRYYRPKRSRSLQIEHKEAGTLIYCGKKVYRLVPVRREGTQFCYYRLIREFR